MQLWKSLVKYKKHWKRLLEWSEQSLYMPIMILALSSSLFSFLRAFSKSSTELNTEDLTILANSGVMKLEVDDVIIDNIRQHSTLKSHSVKLEIAAGSGEPTKPSWTGVLPAAKSYRYDIREILTPC